MRQQVCTPVVACTRLPHVVNSTGEGARAGDVPGDGELVEAGAQPLAGDAALAAVLQVGVGVRATEVVVDAVRVVQQLAHGYDGRAAAPRPGRAAPVERAGSVGQLEAVDR